MFKLLSDLQAAGVLGLNKRNADFIMRYNPRSKYPLVDDKLKTKRLAQSAGISVPALYGVVESCGQLKHLDSLLSTHTDFVIKPSKGSGGQGVLVVSGRLKSGYRRINGLGISSDEVRYHVLNILSGMFSLGGHPDKAIIEYRVQYDPVFENISYLGVPDIRIIVFLGVPVMAMVRLPTRLSDGKANLHQGAIGSGICIGRGRTLPAVWHNRILDEHPDTGTSVSGVTVPKWDDLLYLAARCYELTGLGYQGVDIVLDSVQGPLILEVNARPGLNIQLANRAGLLPRLECVLAGTRTDASVERRVEFAKEHFTVTG